MTADVESWRPSWVVVGAGRAQDPEWVSRDAEAWAARGVDVEQNGGDQ